MVSEATSCVGAARRSFSKNAIYGPNSAEEETIELEATTCMGGGEASALETTPVVREARQSSGKNLMYGHMWAEKEMVSEVMPYVGGDKASVLETTSDVGVARQGVPIRTPFMGVRGQRNRESGDRRHALCRRGNTGSSSKNAISGHARAE